MKIELTICLNDSKRVTREYCAWNKLQQIFDDHASDERHVKMFHDSVELDNLELEIQETCLVNGSEIVFVREDFSKIHLREDQILHILHPEKRDLYFILPGFCLRDVLQRFSVRMNYDLIMSGKESFPKNDLVPARFFPDFEILDRMTFDPRSRIGKSVYKSRDREGFPNFMIRLDEWGGEIRSLTANYKFIPRKRETFYGKIILGETNLESLKRIDQGLCDLIQEYLSSDECSIVCRTCEGKTFFTMFCAGYSLDFLRLVFGYILPMKDVLRFIFDIHEFKNVDMYICHFRRENFVVYINFSHLSDSIEPDDVHVNPKESVAKTLEFIKSL